MDARGGISHAAGARLKSPWADAGAWLGAGLRREVFFFRSGGVELYASLYAAAGFSRPYGVVACHSWGVEADRGDPLVRSAVLAMAKLGGAGLVFHQPGYGDSYGDSAAVDLADLSQAANDAVAEASRRCPGLDWILAGFMLGAAVACLAQRSSGSSRLLLVQPALRPGAYFRCLAESRPLARPAPSKEAIEVGAAARMAYGYPIPSRIADRGPEADAAVSAALEAFDGDGGVIRHEDPGQPDAVPARFEHVVAPGRWRFGAQSNPELAAAVTDWLDRRTNGGGG